MPEPVTAPHCECGLLALPVYERVEGELRLVAYQCIQHGFLSHDALVWPTADDKETS